MPVSASLQPNGSIALPPALQELLAVETFTRQFQHYLLGRHFLIRTDHSSLAWLMRFKDTEGQLARWLEEQAQYDMQIIHRKGEKHMMMLMPCLDFRTPCTTVTAIEEEQRWTRFPVEDVHIALGRRHSGGGSRRMWMMSCHWLQ